MTPADTIIEIAKILVALSVIIFLIGEIIHNERERDGRKY